MPPLPPRDVPALRFHIRPATPADIVSPSAFNQTHLHPSTEVFYIPSMTDELNLLYYQESILRLIKDLATYENEPESAKATPELVSQDPADPAVVPQEETDRAGTEYQSLPSLLLYEYIGLTTLQLQANLFDTPYAHAILAIKGQPPETYADTASSTAPDAPSSPEEAVEQDPLGLALYFFNFSTWTGRPGIYLEDLYVKPEARNLGVGKAMFAELGAIAQDKNCSRMDWAVLKWNTPSIAFYEETLGAKGMDEWRGMRLEEDGIKALAKWSNRQTPPA